MAVEEKRAWIMAVVAIGGYAAYLAIILGRAGATPLAEVPYVSTLLWNVGSAIVAGIVLTAVAAMTSPRDATKKDQRDREIGRFGEYVGHSFVVLGAVTAMGLAMADFDGFWIANTVYLAFVLSAILGSTAKIFAYRRGFQPW